MESGSRRECRVNDYKCIFTSGGNPIRVKDTNELHGRAVAFLKDSITKAREENQIPLVVTHHAPQTIGTSSPECNFAYASDQRELYEEVHAWIFGHTHFACDFIDPTSGTRILSNPKGYPGQRVMFRRNMIIEVS